MSNRTFEFDKVFAQTIKDRGQTHVFFINGVLVPDFNDQKENVGDALNINDLPSSMKLDGSQNPSALPSMPEIVGILTARIATGLSSGGVGLPTLTLEAVGEVITKAVAYAVIDASETLYQIYTDDLSVSNRVNQSWTNKASNWLSSTSKDSVIFPPHSQGNLFVEDGLRVINYAPARVRVIALGSPTDYASAGGLNNNRSANLINYNPDDPITYFQTGSAQAVAKLIAHTLSGVSVGGNLLEGLARPLVPLIKSAFPKEYKILSVIGVILDDPLAAFSFSEGHALGNKDLPKSYLGENLGIQDTFQKFAYELQPQGYYFPKGKESPGQGTEDEDDWLFGTNDPETLDGKGRNDVLKGEGGDDKLIGGKGYDVLDGG